MGSTDLVNFSVRQNKAIERQIVFDGLAKLLRLMGHNDTVYLGFGSVWFVDFVMAHRQLGIERMYSIEADEVVFERAKFNRPYRTIEIVPGLSIDAIPDLLEAQPELQSTPWVLWLDYDQPLGEDSVGELSRLARTAPTGSILLTTFNSATRHYGKAKQRYERMCQLFGDATPRNPFVEPEDLSDPKLQMSFMAEATLNMMLSSSAAAGRDDWPIPAYSIAYQDGSPMVTVGIALCPDESKVSVEALLRSEDWNGIVEKPIITPPLTQKEVSALEACLPSNAGLDRSMVKELGFDLLEEQIEAFVTHYLNYPSFAQIAR